MFRKVAIAKIANIDATPSVGVTRGHARTGPHRAIACCVRNADIVITSFLEMDSAENTFRFFLKNMSKNLNAIGCSGDLQTKVFIHGAGFKPISTRHEPIDARLVIPPELKDVRNDWMPTFVVAARTAMAQQGGDVFYV